MCGLPGHQVRNCEQYARLVGMGWVSYDYNPDAVGDRFTYFFGPRHDRLGQISGNPPPTLQLQWLKGKVQEFFEVSADVLDQPASAVKQEKFKGDSRPQHWRRVNGPGPYQRGADSNSGNANALTGSQYGQGKDPRVDWESFQQHRILKRGDSDDFCTLDGCDDLTKLDAINEHSIV